MKLLSFFLEYKSLFFFWILFLTIGAIFRVVLSLSFLEDSFSDLSLILLYGIRMDTITFSLFGIFFALFYAFNLVKIARIFMLFATLLYFSIEFSGITFMSQFLSRPNALFVEHLQNYKELGLMVWESYSLYVILLLLALIVLGYKSFFFFSQYIHYGDMKKRLILLPFVLALLFLGLRSSVGESTPNASFYTFSKNRLSNEIANNSIFSIAYSLYLMKKEKSYNYGKLDTQKALKRVKKLNHITNNKDNLTHFAKSHFSKEKNIILVILESFGWHHIGYLGGTKTTPNLDNLTKNALYFTNLYAVGTRTSWGVSSILTSLYPLPTREYVKASKAQHNFYTVAKTLKKHNYSTTFLYGGDANFDNMRGFMLANGFDNVYGKESFSSSQYLQRTWGYCDEDLYDKAFKMIQKEKKPFFLTLLTLSSHQPFDYPRGKTKPYKDAPLAGFANSIKYADYALGKFVTRLKESGILKDTIVVFVADHCSKAYSKNNVPIDKYKIAAMIVSDDFKGGKNYNKIASQIDIAPTMLDIAGISDTLPTMGQSVLSFERNSALLLANKRNFAYLLEDKYVLFKPSQKAQIFNYKNNPISNNKEVIKDGLSYIYSSSYLYKNSKYR